MVHREGYPLRHVPQTRGLERLTGDAFRRHLEQELLPSIDRHVASPRCAGEKPQLLIYIHGGLTSHAQALKYVEEMVDPETGCLRGTSFYPIFLIWDASFRNAWWDDMVEIRLGERRAAWWWQPLEWLTAPFRFTHRLASGLILMPETWLYMADLTIAEILVEEPEPDEHLPTQEKIASGVRFGLTLPSKVLTLPVISGFGTSAWEMMNRHIELMFAAAPDQGAARIFFETLRKRMPKPGVWHAPDSAGGPGVTRPVEILLVAHSMGAIAANRILSEFPEMQFDRIVYLGAAASIVDTRHGVGSYLFRHENAWFYSFSLAHTDEGGEVSYWDLTPRGSLLVWIEILFEPPTWVGQRRVGWWRNAKRFVVDPTVCPRVVLVKYGTTDGSPRAHGEFNDNGKLQHSLGVATPLPNACTCVNGHPCERRMTVTGGGGRR
ncbi:MAG: hypothetical protein HY002_13405 [Candidatus Rokubacteria bacterium]|nr:hypothetical protein [Candidatus Rokubacteria bacterium]